MERILLVRFSSLGDVLLTFPAVRALRAESPDAEIVYLTDSRWTQALEGLEVIDEVVGLDRAALRRLSPSAMVSTAAALGRGVLGARWDVAVDLQGFAETAWVVAASRAPVRVGRRVRADRRRWFTHWIDTPHGPDHMTAGHHDTLVRAGLAPAGVIAAAAFFSVSRRAQREWRERAVHTEAAGMRIGLFIGAARPEKRWEPESFARMAALVQREAREKLTFLAFGGPGDHGLVERFLSRARSEGLGECVRAGGNGTLGALAAAWQECALLIANDTGPMHLGVAVGTPTLGIFRRRMPHFWPPAPHRGVAPDGDLELDSLEPGTVADLALQMLR